MSSLSNILRGVATNSLELVASTSNRKMEFSIPYGKGAPKFNPSLAQNVEETDLEKHIREKERLLGPIMDLVFSPNVSRMMTLTSSALSIVLFGTSPWLLLGLAFAVIYIFYDICKETDKFKELKETQTETRRLLYSLGDHLSEKELERMCRDALEISKRKNIYDTEDSALRAVMQHLPNIIFAVGTRNLALLALDATSCLINYGSNISGSKAYNEKYHALLALNGMLRDYCDAKGIRLSGPTPRDNSFICDAAHVISKGWSWKGYAREITPEVIPDR